MQRCRNRCHDAHGNRQLTVVSHAMLGGVHHASDHGGGQFCASEFAPSRVVNPEQIRVLSVKSAVKQFLVVAIYRSPPPIVIQRDHNSMTTNSRGERRG